MEQKNQNQNLFLPMSVLILAVLLLGVWVFKAGTEGKRPFSFKNSQAPDKILIDDLEEKVLPQEGVELPAYWGDLGTKMTGAGVIDAEKFKALYEQRGNFTEEYKNLLLGKDNGKLKINQSNSGYLLNLLWALGLSNKNSILEKGEMADPKYGGADGFVSTGGWTMAQGEAMNYYSRYKFLTLTPDQQALVEKISQGIYRPCCGNSTHFPDCNHGMAMLGLLELMASQDATEQEMWRAALAVNSYWFPENYLTIALYLKNKGIDWKDVNPQEVLGTDYSSSQGYAKIASQVTLPKSREGNSCGV